MTPKSTPDFSQDNSAEGKEIICALVLIGVGFHSLVIPVEVKERNRYILFVSNFDFHLIFIKVKTVATDLHKNQ